MLIKSKVVSYYIANLAMTFNILRQYHMKLNSLKCFSRVKSSKFLGYMVNQQRIKANLASLRKSKV